MDVLSLLAAARPLARSRITAIQPDDWELQTPCSTWDVRALVNHIVYGEAMVRPLLEGQPLGDLADRDLLGSDPLGAWNRFEAEATGALGIPGALEQTVNHPNTGEMPGVQLAVFRIVDNVVHAWDLAVSTGREAQLPTEIIRPLYELMLPFRDVIPATGVFDPPPDVPSNPDLQTSVLALFGRNPNWSPPSPASSRSELSAGS